MSDHVINGVRFTGRPALNPDKYEDRPCIVHPKNKAGCKCDASLRKTDYIAIHCADTPAHLNIGVKEIRGWHLQKGWKDVGYHFVIRRDGTVETGRPLNAIGSHVAGYNTESIGICLVGGQGANGTAEDNFTVQQKFSLELVVRGLKKVYPNAIVQGHRDFPGVTKACPSFNAIAWWKKAEDTNSIPLTDLSGIGRILLVA